MTNRISTIISILVSKSATLQTFENFTDIDCKAKLAQDAAAHNMYLSRRYQADIDSNGAMSEQDIANYKNSGVGRLATPAQRTEYIIAQNNRRIPDASRIKELEQQAAYYASCAMSQMWYLQRIEGMNGGDAERIEFDDGSYNSELGMLENDSMHSALTAVTKKPYFKYKQHLITKGWWPMYESDEGEMCPAHIDQPSGISDESFDVVSKRVAGQLVSNVAKAIHTTGEYIMPKVFTRDWLVALANPRFAELGEYKSHDALVKALMNLSVAHPSYLENANSTGKMWTEMLQLDKDDAAIDEVTSAVSEIKVEVRSMMLDLRKQIALDLGKQEIAAMGLSPEALVIALATLDARVNK